jgi:hypothetical protein
MPLLRTCATRLHPTDSEQSSSYNTCWHGTNPVRCLSVDRVVALCVWGGGRQRRRVIRTVYQTQRSVTVHVMAGDASWSCRVACFHSVM